jgi:hypothetical protein
VFPSAESRVIELGVGEAEGKGEGAESEAASGERALAGGGVAAWF